MLPPAALHAADRLITTLMTLVEAVAHVAKSGNTPTLPEAAAQTLFCRLSRLVTHLIRISTLGVRPPTKPTETPNNRAPAARPSRTTPPMPAARLPRRPGWLLAALPEIAPAVAADISALLADPATATLLNLDPSLHRALRPLLRSLGLDAAPPIQTPPPTPSSSTKPLGVTSPNPAPPLSRTSKPPHLATQSKLARPNTPPFHAAFITISQ